jgi:diguanylate cyclase (GGDEF)-like protein/PAS domain S-box-containing protein
VPKQSTKRTKKQLLVENESLRTWLEEDEEILRAIRSGDWDALILSGSGGEQMITLKASELRYRRLFETTQEGILIVDAVTGTIKDVNPFLINMSGYARDELVEKKLWEIDALKDSGVNLSLSAFETLQENEDIRYEDLPLHAKDGKLIPVEFISNIYLVDDEKVIQCNIRDITKRKQVQDALMESEALLREQSVRDHLTGLFNRRYMEETLERELLRASRKQLPLSIIMLDVDDFKRFNDTYGHAAGDAILREVGNMLGGHVRADDIASRYGGDEFVIVMPDSSQEVARERAKLLGEKVCHLHLRFGGQNLELETFRFSFGVAAFPEDGSTSATILKAVDDALYRAKREGRARESDAG